MIQILSAIATAVILIIASILLSKHFSSRLFAATILCSIAFIYVGFALMGNTVHSIELEVSVAVVFYFIALIGYSYNNALIAYGIVLHGIWDLLHSGSLLKTNIPDYWPLYCLLVDFILGVYFFFAFRMKKK